MPFPYKFSARGAPQPISGKLEKIILPHDQAILINRMVVGIFIDMQDRPLADIMAACYISGAQHAIAIQREEE